jgi:pimeloyl-ACP methyl ester carboxylesterase
LATGQNSIPLFHHFINRLHELIPGSELTEIPHANHLMHEDNAGNFNDTALRFLIKNHQA